MLRSESKRKRRTESIYDKYPCFFVFILFIFHCITGLLHPGRLGKHFKAKNKETIVYRIRVDIKKIRYLYVKGSNA